MSSMLQINYTSGASAATMKSRLRFDSLSGFVPSCIERIAQIFSYVAGGVHAGRISVGTTAIQATGTVTLSSMVATDTITINGAVFTCEASGATGNQFNVGGTDTITAANAAAAINASATNNVSQVVKATSSGAVITVTAITPGYVGNMSTLAISAHGSVSAANLASGSNDALVTFYNGL